MNKENYVNSDPAQTTSRISSDDPEGRDGAEGRLARAKRQIVRLEVERRELKQKLGAAGSLLEEAESEVREIKLMLEAEREAREALAAEREAGQATDRLGRQEGDNRIGDIVALTRLLREQESIATAAVVEMDERCEDAYYLLVQNTTQRAAEADQLAGRISWLRAILVEVLEDALARERAGWFARVKRGTLISRIRREGLFDGERYLSLNRDVAEARINPLLHFIRHGMDERRMDV